MASRRNDHYCRATDGHGKMVFVMTIISPPRHIVWSTDQLDLADPFQRQWYICQVINELNPPPHLHSLWSRFLESRRALTATTNRPEA
jgi:hypothetical protein